MPAADRSKSRSYRFRSPADHQGASVIERRSRIDVALPRDPSAAADARRELRRRLDGLLHQDVLDALSLVVSELVTNAVMHGQGAIRFRLQLEAGDLRGEVIDDGGGFEHELRAAGPHATAGRGLLIVDRLTTRCGRGRRNHARLVRDAHGLARPTRRRTARRRGKPPAAAPPTEQQPRAALPGRRGPSDQLPPPDCSSRSASSTAQPMRWSSCAQMCASPRSMTLIRSRSLKRSGTSSDPSRARSGCSASSLLLPPPRRCQGVRAHATKRTRASSMRRPDRAAAVSLARGARACRSAFPWRRRRAAPRRWRRSPR